MEDIKVQTSVSEQDYKRIEGVASLTGSSIRNVAGYALGLGIVQIEGKLRDELKGVLPGLRPDMRLAGGKRRRKPEAVEAAAV